MSKRINTTAIEKIHNHYNADHDLGPDAPIHWSVEELAIIAGRLVAKVEELEAEVEELKAGQS